MNPFITDTANQCGAVDTASRIAMVERFGRAACLKALQVPDLQKTVRAAVERRLRKLEKEAAA